jgi:hypothetical protein
MDFKSNYINNLITHFKSNELPNLFFTRMNLSAFDNESIKDMTIDKIKDIFKNNNVDEIFSFFNVNRTSAYTRKINYFKKAISIIENNETCSICFEPLIDNSILITSCDHIFHKDCISAYCKDNEIFDCPLCRTENICPPKNDGGRKRRKTKKRKSKTTTRKKNKKKN